MTKKYWKLKWLCTLGVFEPCCYFYYYYHYYYFIVCAIFWSNSYLLFLVCLLFGCLGLCWVYHFVLMVLYEFIKG